MFAKRETSSVNESVRCLKGSKFQDEIIARSNKLPRGGHDPDIAMRLLKPPVNESLFKYGNTVRQPVLTSKI